MVGGGAWEIIEYSPWSPSSKCRSLNYFSNATECCFLWLAIRGMILTPENQRKRKVFLYILVLLMQEGGQRGRPTFTKLQLDYETMVGYVQLVWYVLDDVKVCQGSVVLLECWKPGRRKRKGRAWNVVPLALMWIIWIEGKYEDFWSGSWGVVSGPLFTFVVPM